jgi:membrane-associated phospholipid phosphatase
MNRRRSREESTEMISTDTPANVTQQAAAPQERSWLALRDPRSAALAWLAAYLGVTAALLGAAGHEALAILHLGAIMVVAWSMRPRGLTARAIGDLLPLIVAPLLYAEIPSLIQAIGGGYHDALIQRWETFVFGQEPSRTFAAKFPFAGLSELLHLGYLAYYPAIFAPALLLFARSERRALAETVAAVSLTCLVCWILFALWPVEGPRYLWSAAAVPDGPARRLATTLLERGSSRGAAFPSSHMAVSVAQVVLAMRWQPPLAPVLAGIAVLVGLGAVYGGFHYGVDMLAGAALGAVLGTAVVWWFGTPLQELRSQR